MNGPLLQQYKTQTDPVQHIVSNLKLSWRTIKFFQRLNNMLPGFTETPGAMLPLRRLDFHAFYPGCVEVLDSLLSSPSVTTISLKTDSCASGNNRLAEECIQTVWMLAEDVETLSISNVMNPGDLRVDYLRDVYVKNLEQLRVLTLCDIDISHGGISALSKLPLLEYLSLGLKNLRRFTFPTVINSMSPIYFVKLKQFMVYTNSGVSDRGAIGQIVRSIRMPALHNLVITKTSTGQEMIDVVFHLRNFSQALSCISIFDPTQLDVDLVQQIVGNAYYRLRCISIHMGNEVEVNVSLTDNDILTIVEGLKQLESFRIICPSRYTTSLTVQCLPYFADRIGNTTRLRDLQLPLLIHNVGDMGDDYSVYEPYTDLDYLSLSIPEVSLQSVMGLATFLDCLISLHCELELFFRFADPFGEMPPEEQATVSHINALMRKKFEMDVAKNGYPQEDSSDGGDEEDGSEITLDNDV